MDLATITVNGTSQEVVIQGTKGSQIYVVNAATGKLIYKPIFIGPPALNAVNDGLTSNTTPPANLTASQALFGNTRICPVLTEALRCPRRSSGTRSTLRRRTRAG